MRFTVSFVFVFLIISQYSNGFTWKYLKSSTFKSKLSMVAPIQVNVPLGEGFQELKCFFKPLFRKSKFIIVTHTVPFSLNIEKPTKNGFPAPLVLKDGVLGVDGEQEGDFLRGTTCWSQGFSAAGKYFIY